MPYLNDNPSKRIPQAPGPNAVRSYLAEILVSKYDTTPAAAQGIANQWQFGRVQDFCKAPLSTLSRIFGPDVGLVVFQSIREDVLADWLESNEGLVGIGERDHHRQHQHPVPSELQLSNRLGGPDQVV